jgi:hypothetical protein
MSCKIILGQIPDDGYQPFAYAPGDPMIARMLGFGFTVLRIDLGFTPTPWGPSHAA